MMIERLLKIFYLVATVNNKKRRFERTFNSPMDSVHYQNTNEELDYL